MSDTTLATVAPQGAALAVSTALASDAEFQNMVTLAGMMAESGMFPNARDRNKALTLMMLGREMGFSPVQSLNGLNVISGKPSLGANLMAAKVKASGKYDYRVVQHTATVCEIEFFERGQPTGRSEFSIADAENAGYTSNKQYRQNPRNMLFARAMSNGVKWYCPDVFGGVPVYHDGEIEIAQALRADTAPPAPAPEPGAPENYLTMEEGLFPEEIAEADAFMREIGFNRDSFGRLKEAAGKVGPHKALLEAKRRGIATVEGVIALVAKPAAPTPIDAEFTEQGEEDKYRNPKAVGVGGAGPTTPPAPASSPAGRETRATDPHSPSAPSAAAPPASAGATGGTSDEDRFRKFVFVATGERGIEYAGDGKRAVLAFLSESRFAPKGGYVSSKDLDALVWEERAGVLRRWVQEGEAIPVLDAYLDQQRGLPL